MPGAGVDLCWTCVTRLHRVHKFNKDDGVCERPQRPSGRQPPHVHRHGTRGGSRTRKPQNQKPEEPRAVALFPSLRHGRAVCIWCPPIPSSSLCSTSHGTTCGTTYGTGRGGIVSRAGQLIQWQRQSAALTWHHRLSRGASRCCRGRWRFLWSPNNAAHQEGKG